MRDAIILLCLIVSKIWLPSEDLQLLTGIRIVHSVEPIYRHQTKNVDRGNPKEQSMKTIKLASYISKKPPTKINYILI